MSRQKISFSNSGKPGHNSLLLNEITSAIGYPEFLCVYEGCGHITYLMEGQEEESEDCPICERVKVDNQKIQGLNETVFEYERICTKKDSTIKEHEEKHNEIVSSLRATNADLVTTIRCLASVIGPRHG